MSASNPSQDDALRFYRAALPAVRFVDQGADPALLDGNADAAWRAYGSDLPPIVRCDLVLRNYAMLYPAAFAPGPVFRLSGWYDDDPWGAGFERPSAAGVEALFAKRDVVDTAPIALADALSAWGVRVREPTAAARWADQLSPATNLVVTGSAAAAAVAATFLARERLSARTQILLVSDAAAARHVLGVACALLRQTGVPLLVEPRPEGEDATVWAQREQRRLGVAGARMLVTSTDALPDEMERAEMLARVLGVSDRFGIAEA